MYLNEGESEKPHLVFHQPNNYPEVSVDFVQSSPHPVVVVLISARDLVRSSRLEMGFDQVERTGHRDAQNSGYGAGHDALVKHRSAVPVLRVTVVDQHLVAA